MTGKNGYADLHVHTLYCDGHNSVSEYVEEAVSRGLSAIGFSTHSHTAFDESYCIPAEKIAAYRAELSAARERHKNELSILCGTELDAFSEMSTEGFDYTIGSCHYVKCGDIYYPVDHKREACLSAIHEAFSGDAYAYCEAYFEGVASLCDKRPDIIGHFDLVTKFNADGSLFSEDHPRYVAAWQRACDRLLSLGVPFEVNTGAVSRGYRQAPYPAAPILAYIKEKGGTVLLSSDSHRKENLAFGFAEQEESLRRLGFRPRECAEDLLAKLEARKR